MQEAGAEVGAQVDDPRDAGLTLRPAGGTVTGRRTPPAVLRRPGLLLVAVAVLVACAAEPPLDPTAGADTSAASNSATTDAAASSGGASTGGQASTGPDVEVTGAGPSGSGSTAATDDGASTGAPVDLCVETTLTWENFGEPFMLTWCTSCHHASIPTADRANAPCGVNLDTHADVFFWRDNIRTRAVDKLPTPMPPAIVVPAEQLALLDLYLECGAPGPEPGGAPANCPDSP